MLKLVLKGGRIIDPAQKIDKVGDVLIEDGVIAKVGGDIDAAGAEVFDARGLVVAPGFIDMHAHLREPGQEAKEDFASGTRAAAAGGFTTVCTMPNTRPAVDDAVLVNGLIRRAELERLVNVKIIGAVTKGQEGKELAEVGDMLQAGAVALSDDGRHVANAKILRTGFEYAGMFGGLIISHAEEASLVEDGFMHEGAVSAMLGLKGRPAVAEDIAVGRDVMLAEYTGGRLHVAHVSTAGAVELIRRAKARGVKVTAEATPHHLTLTDEAVIGYDPATKVNPPLRSQEHVDALVAGLKDGTVDCIATDHAPHAFEEKDVEFRYAPSGFTGLETAVGVVLTGLYHSGKLTLPEVIEKLAAAPARVLGLEAGSLKAGAAADVTVLDPAAEWTVDSAKFYTRGKCTPFEGKRLKGRAVATIVGGRFVMKDGEVCG
ncbi:dihydroorotase [Anaeroselena agilis]|uniref:Dihydroorotase n=1 Tax=Anaeroselena agilis TaxID=3063788 RepID=A0ABU3NVC0_9FIRM|nr:dihydroorotase [Selenomonadales bacterium 4137-cl]